MEIDPDAHDWNEGVITTPATCSAKGVKTFTCKNNPEHTKTETLPELKLPKLGSSLTTTEGEPAYDMIFLRNSYTESALKGKTLADLQPAGDLGLWACDENGERINATLTWSEGYGSRSISSIFESSVNEYGYTLKVHIAPTESDRFAECDAELSILADYFMVIWRAGSANGTELKRMVFQNGCLLGDVTAQNPPLQEGEVSRAYIFGNGGETYPGSEDPSKNSTPLREEELVMHNYQDESTTLYVRGLIWDTVIIYTVSE